MFEQPRHTIWAAPSLLAGFLWISTAAGLSFVASLLPWVIGGALLSGGVTQLVAPGDRRMTQLGALAGLVAALLALPYAFVVGPATALGLFVAGLAGTWSSGRVALQLEPHIPGVPAPTVSAATAAKVAADDLILGFEMLAGTVSFPLDGTIERVIDEIDLAHSQFARDGFLEKPETYHVAPPDLVDPEIRLRDVAGQRVEVLRFESGYAPPEDEPGRERWLGYDACRDGWAYVLRHDGPPRPWLIATNGYRMGRAPIDVSIFARFFHDGGHAGTQRAAGLGLNVLIPVLPLHGPRRRGWHSGDGMLGIELMDTIHAETQGLWDMRRLLSWIRSQGSPAVGAFGLSLGGLTTANFASLAEGLASAVPGIPLVDIRRTLDRHGASHQLRYAESLGLDLDRVGDVLRVIDPTRLTPQVPHEGRFLFAGTADRLVTPDQVRDLWRHWDEPEIVWYDGAHVSFALEPAVWEGVDRTLRENGLAA